MNELKVFENPAFGQVRTTTINDEPWFVGKDVAEILGYANTKDAIASHVDADDKRVIQRSEIATLDIPNRGLTIINESGLYSLILSSKLPTAKEFKHWVTSEVLPAIRKTGKYINPRASVNPELAEKRANAMALNAKCRVAKQMMGLWSAAGVTPEYQALALNGYYEGLELPRIALKSQAPALFDKTTIAQHLGVMSRKGKPHSQAIGAIISQLTLLPEESAVTPYSRNGHDGQDVQYTKSVEDKVANWLETHDYPTSIEVIGKTFKVSYRGEV